MSVAPDSETLAKPETLIRVPVGLASPLWGLFAGAAMSGAAWWWMTRWARPRNLEAMFAAAPATQAVVEPEAAPFAAAVEATESLVGASVEPVLQAVAEAPVLEALAEAPAAPEPVGGEGAPISPVLEALTPEVEPPAEAASERAATPKARKKPQAD